MTSDRKKKWLSVFTAASLAMSLGVLQFSTVSAAPGENAFDVPGLNALNTRGSAEVLDISCAAPGDCSAVGTYLNDDSDQVFVVSQVAGVWGTAIDVPGLKASNIGAYADAPSISCPAPGYCSAVGTYSNDSGTQGFVVSQVDGVWGTAIDMPQIIDPGFDYAESGAEIFSVSCAAPGYCTAGGIYDSDDDGYQALVVSQVDGVWGTATNVPGMFDLNDNGIYALVNSVSCAAPGYCTAGGMYQDGIRNTHGFVVSQVDGVWGTATNVPGLNALDTGGSAGVELMSCATPGNCSASGVYADLNESTQVFVVSQVDGVWGTAIDVPNLKALATDNYSSINSMSCATPGNCTAGGTYFTPDNSHGFLVSQVDGVWYSAADANGLKSLNTAGASQVDSVDCVSPGNCVAGGFYSTPDTIAIGATEYFAYYLVQTGGLWGPATRIPGLGILESDNDGEVNALACAPDGTCVAGGYYSSESIDPITRGNFAAFEGLAQVVDQGYLFELPIIPGGVTPTPEGSVTTVAPSRLVETRDGLNDKTVDGLFQGIGKVKAGSTTRFQVAGRGDVPEGAAAALLNVGSIRADGPGYFTVWSCEGDPPLASHVNFGLATVVSNLVLTGLNDDGEACIYSLAASDLIVDINGYVPAEGSVTTVAPSRLVETRDGLNDKTVDGLFQGIGKVKAGSTTRFQVAGRGDVPEGAAAALLNVGSIRADGPGYFTVWSCEGDPPLASHVNFGLATVVSNLVLTGLNDDGEACIYSLAASDLIVDINGYVPAEGSVTTVAPSRLVETRDGLNDKTVDGLFQGIGKVKAGSTTRFQVAGRGDVPEGAAAALLNVGSIRADGPGYFTVWSCEGDPPLASHVNFGLATVVSNLVLTGLNDDGEACIYSLAASDLIVDINGYVYEKVLN